MYASALYELEARPLTKSVINSMGGSSTQILGRGHCPISPFITESISETEKMRTPYGPTFEIYH